MPLSMSALTVPVFVRMLTNLSALLDKGVAFAEAKKIEPGVLLASRLAPDMFPLSRQIQLSTDFAKGTVARLAGMEPPPMPDTETTVAELKERIAKTIAFVKSVDASAIDAGETRDVTITMRTGAMTFKGTPYMLHFAMPNFYFHVSAAYAILRENGVDVGKRDFMGQPDSI